MFLRLCRDLKEDGKYEVRVRARNYLGWSEPCNPCEVILDGVCDIPTPPAPHLADLVKVKRF